MAYPIERKLVVAVSSNALFDLVEEDNLFREKGLDAYRECQIKKKDIPLGIGLAFPFVKRFLNINEVYEREKPVEVVLLSKNSPETGIRIFNSIKHHGLDITRAVFTSGTSPYKYIPAFNVSMFLSTSADDVGNAIEHGYAAGKFIQNKIAEEGEEQELRVAFDFDGVIADDESEQIYQERGIEEYYRYETEHAMKPHNPGPLADFFKKLSYFQKLETKKHEKDSGYNKILKTAIITARNSPAHERAVNTLKDWGVAVDEMFLLGGIEKKRILEIFKPHLFMDDQITHLDPANITIPMVHVPFGKINKEESR